MKRSRLGFIDRGVPDRGAIFREPRGMKADRVTYAALLRAIGPTTHKVMPMAALRDAATEAGLEQVSTLLATGNVIFEAAETEARLIELWQEIVQSFGLENAVFMRSGAELVQTRASNPFPEAARVRPNHLLVLFLQEAMPMKSLDGYDGPERISQIGREVFIDYVEGVGRSRLTPARLERALGQPGTARNWNTLGKLIAKTV